MEKLLNPKLRLMHMYKLLVMLLGTHLCLQHMD